MEIFRFNILSDEEYTQKEIFKHSVLNCQICGSGLHFEHAKLAESTQIHEEAHCPSCQIQMKPQVFALH